jgi:hypothetical protein
MYRSTLHLLTFLLIAVAGPSCTTRYRVPQTAIPCANACKAAQQRCQAGCGNDTGRPQVVEDVREHLCTQRCTQEFEECMLACPGVE